MKTIVALLACATVAAAGPLPKGYKLVPKSTSPDGKLAVIAPELTATLGPHDNKLIEVATGNVLASLVSTTAAFDQNALDFEPRWSSDGSLLEWYIDGKWGSWALVLVRLDKANGAVTSQIDARELAVHEVLADVQRDHAQAAAAVKREGSDSGSWFRDGLAIDVRPTGTRITDDGMLPPKPALPLSLDVTYTSDPKAIAKAKVSGTLALAIDARGKLAPR